MFPDTPEYREQLIREFGIRDARVVKPDPKVLAEKDEREYDEAALKDPAEVMG